MNRPTFEVADIVRVQGDHFLDRYRSSLDFQHSKYFSPFCAANRRAGWTSGCCSAAVIPSSLTTRAETGTAPSVRASTPALAGGPRTRIAVHQLLPCRVHAAPRTNVLALENPRCSTTCCSRQRSNLAGDRQRSQTPGRRDRLHQHPAYLGSEPASASPYTLRHSRGRTFTRSPSMVRPRYAFFLPVKVLSRVFRGKFFAGLKRLHSRNQTPLHRPCRRFGRSAAIRTTHPPPVPPRLGRLRQAAFGGPCRCCATSAATPIAWPFLIIACWPSTKSASPFAGRITLTAASRQDDSCRH